MRRIFLISFGLLSLFVIGIAASGGLGYYSHKLQLQPIYALAERVDTKARRILGMPTVTEGLVEQIETIYLNLQGETYLMPDNDFKIGGALAAWDDDVLAMHKSGKIFVLEEDGRGLVQTGIQVPDNGFEGYVKLAADKYPGRSTRADAVRYNDLEWIEEGALRGFVLSYTYIDVEQECYRSRVSWLPVPDSVSSVQALTATPDQWELVFETNPCLAFNPRRELIVPYMAGGRVAFKAPNLLYLGSGEYHLEGFYRPDAGIQSPESDYGKTIEINLETRTARHYSIGHRNLQGVTLDKEGRLWTTEHGMRGGDELNLIVDGENYGWPLENLGTLYSGVPAPSASGVGRHEVYKAPVYAWLPSAAVSTMATIDGFHDAWDGDLLIGSLKGRTLFRARIRDERLMFLESIPIGQRIRDVMQVDADRIALWLDTNELVILSILERANPLEGVTDKLIAGGMSSDLAEESVAVLEGCSECHYLREDLPGAGPSLYDLYERPVASTSFENYSDALRGFGGAWDAERLAAYLESPEDLVPGTSMTGFGVGDPDLARALVETFRVMSEED